MITIEHFQSQLEYVIYSYRDNVQFVRDLTERLNNLSQHDATTVLDEHSELESLHIKTRDALLELQDVLTSLLAMQDKTRILTAQRKEQA